MQNQRERKADRLSGIGWIIFGTVIVVHALMMETRDYLGATFVTGPGLVPALIGGGIAILGAVMLLRSFHGEVAAYFDDAGPGAGRRVAISLALMLVYGLGMIGRVPFWLATFLFVTAFVLAFKLPVRGTRAFALLAAKAALTGALTAVTISFVFEAIFLVRLP